jgi:hypothetical protein
MPSASPRAFLPILVAALCLPINAQLAPAPQPKPVPMPKPPPQPKPTLKPVPSLNPPEKTAHLPSSLGPNDQKALDYLLKRVVINDTVILPGTGNPLTPRGTWSVAKERPALCPADATTCDLILYSTPDSRVTCQWVVLLNPDGAPSILDQNADATHYMLRIIPTAEAEPYVISRQPTARQPLRTPGTVEIGVIVSATGSLTQIMTISGPENLRTIAFDMAGRWTFRPLTVGSHNIPYQTIIKFHFDGPEVKTEP